MIRSVKKSDASAIAAIYNYYIEHSVVTFEESLITPQDMLERLIEIQELDLPFYVAETADEIIGYAFASKWKGRCAYKFSVEITVYLSATEATKGWGTKLYKELFKELKDKDFHVVLGGISLPNDASIALHEKFGMKKVAHLEEVGFKFNRWVDVGYWQGLL